MTSRIFLVIVAVLIPMLGGCAGNKFNGSGAAQETGEILPVETTSMVKAHARLDGGALVVFGNVRKVNEFKKPGHVHIEVRKPDGTLVGESRQELFAHASKRGGVKEVKFRTQMDIDVQEDPLILAWYHAHPFGEE